jgi:hypothetical protein
MHTLHDIQTKANKEGMMISLILGESLEQLEQAREDGDEFGQKMIIMAIMMMLDNVEPIEE